MDAQLVEVLIDRLEHQAETLERISAELVAIRTDLNYHIARSNKLEDQVEILKQDYVKVKGFFMYLGWTLASIATVAAIAERFMQ